MNIDIVEAALSNQAGEKVIASVLPGKFGQARLGTNSVGEQVEVVTTTLDVLLSDIKKIALMKLDVEGNEILALSGAGKALSKIDVVIFEAWNPRTDATNFLIDQGFQIKALDSMNKIAIKNKSAS
ncbi:FkbM family methyltransferase [Fontimonas thermophila]|uniref:FkbM family methyltransferase n=1 Tax=Fontimonas thermophila TaxID=1076937 RepID=UPI0013565281|nr:FkbM family methyltransferase [Fontimonas thermophila]